MPPIAMRAALPIFLCAGLCAQTTERPVRSVTDPGVVTTRQAITPAGVPTVFQGRVYGVVFGASPPEIWVLTATRVYRLDPQANRVLYNIPLDGAPSLQGIRLDEPAGRVLVGSTARSMNRPESSARVQLFAVKDGRKSVVAPDLGSFLAGSFAVASHPNPHGQRLAVMPLTRDNKLAVLDLTTGKVLDKIASGIAPFGAVVNQQGTVAYVTNWAGRMPRPADLTAAAGLAPRADRIVVDGRGIASTGTVTRVDLASMTSTHTIPVELHPTGIVWDEPRERLYVANGNKDSVSVIDTRENRVLLTIALQPFQQKVTGIAPTALAISPDGSRLYVACGGINAVAVVETKKGGLEGLIPAGWYPNAVALSGDGSQLAVGSLLGAGSGWREAPQKRFVHACRGMVSLVPVPDKAQLASYTTVVAENNRMLLAGAPVMPVTPAATAPAAVPARAGDPSPIEHIVYIVKENRTYDQVFGDIEKGNGDPSLVMFGRDVTPNQHRLAEQFVLLDNFYATGGNSADGHQWLTQANETDYCLWPGYAGRSYPFDGSDPMAYAQGGFLWDAALARGKAVKIYGEFAGRLPEPPSKRRGYLERWRNGEEFSSEWRITAPIAPLNKIIAANYPSYTTSIPDVVRARIFLRDLREWERQGKMPHLTILQLPSNHTNGTSPGVSTPKAMVADNDLALGQIVEALTKTRFWPKMAIFVVEDDAQNGVDHVDGHRTVALAISPYTRRGHVDSTFYSHQSILKTIELMLGLPTLSLFDLIAHDMRASFTDKPDTTPYTAEQPEQSLFEMNPPVQALQGRARKAALQSARMRWDVPDAAPTSRLNRILWHSIRGWKTPYPGARQAVFAPLSLDLDDDER